VGGRRPPPGSATTERPPDAGDDIGQFRRVRNWPPRSRRPHDARVDRTDAELQAPDREGQRGRRAVGPGGDVVADIVQGPFVSYVVGHV